MELSHIIRADSYKVSHRKQYPPGTKFTSSYIESRGGEFPDTLFFGLQFYLKEYLSKPITMDDIDVAESYLTPHLGDFDREPWEIIVRDHGGYLPIRVDAIEEGTIIPTKNALVQVMNTDDRFPWLTSYVETALHRAVWYPVTIATLSHHIRRDIYNYLEMTSDNPDEEILFKLHDFGARGVTTSEQAGIGGLAHLVNFRGTDTIESLPYGREYYHEPCAGFSIPASEHSTITSWGGPENEILAFRNMLDEYGQPGKMFSCVSDSYDIWNACENLWGGELKEQVIKSGATLVIRPDSGDPVQVPVECIEILMEKFGHTLNSKGYKVLPDYVRVIQGDGIDRKDISAILSEVKRRGMSVSNIAFGMGGGLLQKVNRDTLKFAMKQSAIYRPWVFDNKDGPTDVFMSGKPEWFDVYKQPVTDIGKDSKKGIQAVVKDDKGFYRTEPLTKRNHDRTLLKPVFRNGDILRDFTLEDVRKKAYGIV